ncbi:sigma-54 dependent transcriptional regulator [Desulfobacterales bacterium HSG17]|nr:sigma-54 dependent transcriptional regulator [Desulfobacterales bacterium HSG17]
MSKNIKPRVLIVDDEPDNIRILANLLKKKFIALAASNGPEALELAVSENGPDIILLDILMPDMNGYEVCRHLKTDPRTSDIPVIFITAMEEYEDETRGFESGAVDYITKPFNPSVVEARIQTHLELKQYRDQLELLVSKRTQALEKEVVFRKSIEESLRTSESKLASIVNAFGGFIYTTRKDAPYQIDFMNKRLADHIGSDKIGNLCYKAIFGFKKPCSVCKLSDVSQGAITEAEIEHRYSGKWYHIIQTPITIGEDQGVQSILIDISKRKLAEKELRENQENLRRENLRLRSSLKDRYRFGNIIGKSRPMQEVYENIVNAASTDAGVIIYGESGTGKELAAHAIHKQSERSKNTMVTINCGAIPETLGESEFFGYIKGAFTGAESDKAGYLEMADRGTLFLDEIGEISLNMQVKLLRAIEGAGYSPLGSRRVIKPDIRIIAATNRNLQELIKNGQLREDFYFRIHVIPIHLPPLRERKEDIPLLIEDFSDSNGFC